jgi:hypothetical protein
LHENYLMHHPSLIVEEFRREVLVYKESDSSECISIFEVYAYYENEKIHDSVDRATKLRFIQRSHSSQHESYSLKCQLPGLVRVHATFDSTCMGAYFDHWVSNGTILTTRAQ